MAGLGETFGSGAMTNDYDSIKSADVIMVIGSNTTETHPVIGAMIKERAAEGAKLIVCDPRKIELHKYAAFSVRHTPGSDTALLNAMMQVIIEENLQADDFIRERTENYAALKEMTAACTPEWAQPICGIDAEVIREAARTYAKGPNSAIFFTMGITQHITGTDNVRSCCNLALLCGMLGRAGTGVNPLRGQNNVQGACDMGCLPATLPGYIKVGLPEAAEKVRTKWGVPMPADGRTGLSVALMTEAAGRGELKGLYVIGENPAVTDADTNHATSALKKLEFLVVQDIFMTETAALADVVLPAACWPEKEGTCTNTCRGVQLLRKAAESPGSARDDWRIIADLAAVLGHDWRYGKAEDIFKDIAGFVPAYAGITYDRLARGALQWPCPDEKSQGTPILHTQKFARPNGRARFAPAEWKAPHEQRSEEYPFLATTGRNLYHYHSGSMSRRSAPGRHMKEMYVEINPADAEKMSVADGDMLRVTSRRGAVCAAARVTDMVMERMVFLPFHYPEAPANAITSSEIDAVSETPGFKISAVRVEKVEQ